MTLLRCPACGYSKDVPEERLPADLSRIKCPKCQQVFAHQQDGDGASATDAAAGSTTLVRCPHCHNEKQVPSSRIPPGRHQLRCWHCGERFELLQKTLPPAAETATGEPGQLPPVIDLFSRCWQLYKRRVWTLLGIYLATVLLPMFVVGIVAAVLVPLLALGDSGLGAGILGLLLVLLVAGLVNWGMVGMVVASVDATAGFKQSLTQGWRDYWAFGWMFFLLSFIVVGGFFLLVVPAFIFMTWFLFAQYILVDEGERGMDALLKSREYVRGYFWAVLLRLLVLWVSVFFLSMLLGWIPLLGNLLQLLILPFTLLYQFLVLHDLREARGSKLQYHPDKREKWLLVGVAALGYLVIPVAFWVANVPQRVEEQVLAWEMQRRVEEQSPQVSGGAPASLEETLGEEQPPPQAISRQEYRQLLQQVDYPADAGDVSLGPVAVRLERFWEGNPPHLWLKVRLPQLPNLELMGDKAVRVEIDRVRGDGDSNQYDRSNPMEKPFFQRIGLTSVDGRTFEGLRDIYLRPGTAEDELKEVSGAVVLRLPVGIKTVELSPSNMGESFKLAGTPFRFKTLQQGSATFEFSQGDDHLLDVVGYNSAGEPLLSTGWGRSGTSINFGFQGELFAVKLIMATDFTRDEYPFDLNYEEN